MADTTRRPARRGALPAFLVPAWGNRTVDPRDNPAYCARQARRTPTIPWHNGATRCLACGKETGAARLQPGRAT